MSTSPAPTLSGSPPSDVLGESMPAPPTTRGLCFNEGECHSGYVQVRFSSFRGHCGTLVVAPGMWEGDVWKHHCSLKCLAKEIGEWSAIEGDNHVPLAHRASGG